MIGKLWYDFCGWVAVQWKLNRRLFVILGLFLIFGIVIGIITVVNPLVTNIRINRSMIDANIIHQTMINQGFTRILFARMLDFALASIFLFLVCLNRFTVLFAFALIAFRAYLLVINIYWCVSWFGVVNGLVLAITYGIILLSLIIFFMCYAIYMLKSLQPARQNGLRHGICWGEQLRGMGIFAIVMFSIAIIECIIHWLILSNFIYVII